jgi:hypothetical protein
MNSTIIYISDREIAEMVAGTDDADFVDVYLRAAYITLDGNVAVAVDYEEKE